MDETIDVLVIGVEGSCPRCDLLVLLVEQIAADLGLPVAVKHCAYGSEEAITLAEDMGIRIGPAKEVAEAAGVEADWDRVYDLIQERRQAAGPDSRLADAWTPELDSLLQPVEEQAERVGFLMTPVLIVDGQVRHHGSVPSREQIAEWLRTANQG